MKKNLILLSLLMVGCAEERKVEEEMASVMIWCGDISQEECNRRVIKARIKWPNAMIGTAGTPK